MKLKFLLGGLSALVAVGGIANLAQAQSSVGSTSPNTDAVFTIDRSTGSPLEASTTDPLAIKGMQSHSATPTNVLVMEGDLVRSYPIASITGSGASDSLEANPDGSYTHTAADGTEVTIAAPAAAVTSSLTANADGSFDHDDGTGNVTTIPAPTSDKVENNGNGTYTHTAVDGSETTWNGQAPVGVWLDTIDMTRADLTDKSILLPPNPANANPHVSMHLLGQHNQGELGATLAVNNDEARWQVNTNSYLFAMAASPLDTVLDTFEMRGDGRLQAHQYGAGTFDNASPSRFLGVNASGVIVEVDPTTVGGGSGAISTLTANPDGSYTHDDGNGNTTTIAAPAAAVTSSLTANADGSFDHDDGTGNVTTIPAPAAAVTSSLTANADGSFDHDDGTGNVTNIPAPAAAVTSSLTANADGSFDHDDGTGNVTNIPAPAAAVTSSLTANADGSFDHDDGTGNVTTIPAPTSDKVENNGNGTYTHTAVDGSETTWNGQAPVGVWLDTTDMTRADLNDKSILLPPNPANANPHVAMTLLGQHGDGKEGASLFVNNDLARWQVNTDSYLFQMAASPLDTVLDTFEMRGDGRLQAHQYGAGTFDNASPTRFLGVNAGGVIVEVDPATVGGSGATSTLTANADGSFDHDDGTGNVTTIPAPAAAVTSSLTDNGDGTYEHSDGAATATTLTFDTSNAWHPVSDTSASAVGSTAEDIIFDGGQVGIGVTPSEQLHVAGNALLTGNLYTNSDSRLKTNIVEFEGSLASVMNIEPVTFDWINEGAHTSGTQLGFIAQDVLAALPEAVIVSEDELGTLSVADRPILAASIGAIQELKAENDALKAELEDMKSQMQQMELLQLAVMSMQAQLADMAEAEAVMKANFSL